MGQRKQVMEAASALGGTAVMQYWNDVVTVGMSLSERQAALWSGIWQQTMSGATTSESARLEMQRVWTEYLHAISTWTMFPVQWWLRWIGDVPTTVFVLDFEVNASWVQSIASPSAIANLPLFCTDLQLVTGTPGTPQPGPFKPGDATLPSKHVLLRKAVLGERLDVQIVDLRQPPSMPVGDGETPLVGSRAELHDGFSHYQYVGVIYAQELQVRRPLALLTVVFMPASSAR
jgi:hypothetical protein